MLDRQEIERQQQQREDRISAIMAGSAQDDEHIRLCLELADREADDVVRVYAGLWLRYNIRPIAQRLLGA